MKCTRLICVPLLLLASAVAAQSIGPLRQLPISGPMETAPPPRLAETFGIAPLAVLPEAAEAARGQLAALQAWNDAGHVPVQNGFTRSLPAPRRVEIDAGLLSRAPVETAGGMLAETSFGRVAWGAEVTARDAWRLRLHLKEVRLPAGTRLWVHGDSGEVVGPFGLELRGPAGDLWTPSVGGESLRIDVELPSRALAGGARFGFQLAEVLEMLPVEGEASGTANTFLADATPCEVDLACANRGDLPFMDEYRHAVARYQFIDNGSGFLCTGALLNDTDSRTEIPYFLTAHHCLSSQTAAATVDAFFDYYRTSCGGATPSLSSVPRSHGATLLATGSQSDFTLLRLSGVPSGRVFLGWNADERAIRDDVRLYRLSHPGGRPQAWSITRVDIFALTCRDTPRPDFIYSTRLTGSTSGGSSGSPTVTADGRVVGQLLGGCGDTDDCSLGQATVDGAFSTTYRSVRQFLAPAAPCTSGPTNLCLVGNRFRVELSWQNQFDGTSGVARAVPRTDSTGFFYFTDPANFELIVKMLDFGDVVKLFYGQLTDLQFTLTVTDTRTGDSKQYHNGPGNCGAIDQAAFPGLGAADAALFKVAPQTAKRGTCVSDADTLCLMDRRFSVEVTWRNQFNGDSGKAREAPLTQQAGMFSYTDPTNIELVVKALDFGDHILFFWGALSDLEYTITLTDTTTGATKTYHNDPGHFCGGLDDHAF